ncbi:cell division actin-like ATPase [Desulfofarcimen acetoxidans DSM 771]|uniref:Cell division actin-like ATPase n=1 Tax=Desulfofarcimen acetoxidans (strain ATCC 49208 / DSM 771 / KCTC 5769 / VKM B-1644 / 5575) TaxID=485916 RepID=C8VXK7_DESAS|nr:cell division FtsA domain-containing protein [Desulfofarcimen acetoxidans]ACV62663.1 cell division actin-like ATPase [Desulfofarcimen acetoxidans DSM 771]
MEFEYCQNQYIFALDIGTRSVIGIVGKIEDDRLKIEAEEMLEHNSRTMYDGQIHNVPKVAEAIRKIKNSLERKTGQKLHQVAVAAAGRSLITKNHYYEQIIDNNIEIDRSLLRSFEQAALDEIYQELLKEIENKADYHCIGHSIITYKLDDFPITSLIGHRGKKIGAQIIATFLPKTVINGLYSVLYRCSLEPINLTLEPIAAIEVAIPESLRLLNLALVDIGAGTSDIAISKNGSIIAYGMVPLAGDKITEEIVQAYLVNFNTAEQIKRQLSHKTEIIYTDILGQENTVFNNDLMKTINPALDLLVEEICDNILKLNDGVAPRSVFCIGGGCQIPTLRERMSRRLNLDYTRVIIRDRAALVDLERGSQNLINGPDGVTVIGIAAVAYKNLPHDFISITVNDHLYRIPKTQNTSVASTLCAINYDIKNLLGKNNASLQFTLNGQKTVLYEEKQQSTDIFINGLKANLNSIIRDGDEISIGETQRPIIPRSFVRDYLPETGSAVEILLNEEAAYPDTEIKNGDILKIIALSKAENANVEAEPMRALPNKAIVSSIHIADNASESGEKLTVNDTPDKSIISDSSHEILPAQQITVFVNGEAVKLSGKYEHIMLDIFDAVNFDTTRPQGKLVFKLNSQDAAFTEPINDGDKIELGWEPRDLKTT